VSGKALMIALGSVIWFFDVFFASMFPYLLTVRIPYFAEFFNINFLVDHLKLMRGLDLKEDSEDTGIIKPEKNQKWEVSLNFLPESLSFSKLQQCLSSVRTQLTFL
jgi:hypothetical protein